MRSRAGYYEILGETYAKFEFFEKGWNPYSRFLRRQSREEVGREGTHAHALVLGSIPNSASPTIATAMSKELNCK